MSDSDTINPRDLPGLKERELGDGMCKGCGNPLLEAGPVFYRVTVEQFMADGQAINRRMGLIQTMQGHHQIAAALGPDEDLAKRFAEAKGLLCATCGTSPSAILAVMEGD